MYKFVLCLLVAAAVAEPEPSAIIAPYSAPLAYQYSPSYYAPAATTFTKTSSVYNPYFYSSPYYPHFIKKRSAPFFASSYSYNGYAPSTYLASAPLLTQSYSTPLVHSAPYVSAPLAYSAPAHFIKKRSVGLLPSTYVAPATYTAPLPLAHSSYSYAAAAPILPSATVYTSPFAYSHFIKKRSAPFYASGYIAPATYAAPAAAPLLTSTYTAATPIYSPAPYYAATPFGYASYIKK